MTTSIPTTQTAAWLEKPQPGARFQIRNDIDVPTPGDGDVLIKLDYTGFWYATISKHLPCMRQRTYAACDVL